jgi:hypothetical protein
MSSVLQGVPFLKASLLEQLSCLMLFFEDILLITLSLYFFVIIWLCASLMSWHYIGILWILIFFINWKIVVPGQWHQSSMVVSHAWAKIVNSITILKYLALGLVTYFRTNSSNEATMEGHGLGSPWSEQRHGRGCGGLRDGDHGWEWQQRVTERDEVIEKAMVWPRLTFV